MIGGACTVCANNYYLENAALGTCTIIPDVVNCAVEINNVEGKACATCEANYYRTDVINCALLTDINCATGH